MLLFYIVLFAAALTPSFFFGRWLRTQNWDLKDKIAAWDPFIKVTAIAGAVILGLASFERYLEQHRQDLAKEMGERLEEPKTAFRRATVVTATIATAPDLSSSDTAQAVTAFWQLYWGDLARFEGREVEVAMVQFGRALQAWQKTGQKPPDIEQLSLSVAHASRTEIDDLQKRIDAFRDQYSLL
jgi:hypothetical protein